MTEEVHRLRVSERLLLFILVSLFLSYFSEVKLVLGRSEGLVQLIKMSHEAFAGEFLGRSMLENDASVRSRLILSYTKSLAFYSESVICSSSDFVTLTLTAHPLSLTVCTQIYCCLLHSPKLALRILCPHEICTYGTSNCGDPLSITSLSKKILSDCSCQ